jgi:hypothetical protein
MRFCTGSIGTQLFIGLKGLFSRNSVRWTLVVFCEALLSVSEGSEGSEDPELLLLFGLGIYVEIVSRYSVCLPEVLYTERESIVSVS